MSETLEVDVAVVGAGVAGALVASELAGDASVLLLDAGPRIARSDALDRFWASAVKTPESPYPESPLYPHPRSGRQGEWYVQEGPDTFYPTYLRVVGGTTWHWLGTALRFVPDDFRLRSKFARGLDWPLDYTALEPWYAKAEAELGVAGDASDDLGSPRSGAFPLPGIALSYCDRAFAKALTGTPYAAVRSTPQARNSTDYQDRPPCCGSASCIPICPIQAKYDATVHVDAAEKKGARLLESAVVTRLEAAADGRIERAHVKRADGGEVQVRAKVFVLAAYAIETPRLLLNSVSETYPKGLANRSDQVGRNLMDHPIQLSWALTREPVWPYRGPLSTSGIDSFRSGSFRKERPAHRIEINNSGWSWPTGAPLTTARRLVKSGLRGKALDDALFSETSRQVTLSTLIEQLPDPQNRVSLDPDKRDAYGVPRPRIAYRVGDYARRGLTQAVQAHSEIFQALGVSEMHHGESPASAYHIMGTARMGDDPDRAVVDPDLRAHDHPNLYILGSAAFPTSAAANPTLTIAALSLRAVEPIRRTLAS